MSTLTFRIKPKTDKALTFTPSKKITNVVKIPMVIQIIELPAITTMVEHTENTKPVLLSEKSVSLVYTHEQQTIFSIEHIDIDRISEKRSSSQKVKSNKSNYTVDELRNIARNIGISGANLMNKKDLAIMIREKITKLKSSER